MKVLNDFKESTMESSLSQEDFQEYEAVSLKLKEQILT